MVSAFAYAENAVYTTQDLFQPFERLPNVFERPFIHKLLLQKSGYNERRGCIAACFYGAHRTHDHDETRILFCML
jgi:hypothetical protein